MLGGQEGGITKWNEETPSVTWPLPSEISRPEAVPDLGSQRKLPGTLFFCTVGEDLHWARVSRMFPLVACLTSVFRSAAWCTWYSLGPGHPPPAADAPVTRESLMVPLLGIPSISRALPSLPTPRPLPAPSRTASGSGGQSTCSIGGCFFPGSVGRSWRHCR